MKCDFCSNDASIEIVVFVNGEAKKIKMCASCYKDKLKEMVQDMPKEWGGAMLAEQLNAMLEHADAEGLLAGGMQLHISDSDDIGEIMPEFHFEKAEVKKDPEVASARDIAFDKQYQSLRRKRRTLIQKLESALDREDYENCALYRDEIAKISDELVKLNEERKDPHGV